MNNEIISYIYIVIIVMIAIILSIRVSKQIGGFIFLVLIVHMSFSYLYFIFTKYNSADANMYFARGLLGDNNFGSSTDFIIFLSTFFINIGFSKFALFFLFGFFGFIGYLYLIRMIDNSRLSIFGFPMTHIVLLLPGFHFWTSALGKDSLFFMALMMLLYSVQNIKGHIITFVFSITLLTLIRPHMGFIIVLSFVLAIFLRNPLKYQLPHILIGVISIISIILFSPFIIQFLDIDSLEASDMQERLNFYTDYGANQTDGLSSYIDVRSYSLPEKMFAYLFRPLFFDAHSILQFLASFENLFLFILLYKWLKLIRFKVIKWYNYLDIVDKIFSVYFLLGWIILAAGMYNLGLASRQKYMLLPVLFILVFKNLNKSGKYRMVKNNINHLLNK